MRGLLNAPSHSKPLATDDLVVFYAGYEQLVVSPLKKGGITRFKFGEFHHDDVIGKTFGSKVFDRMYANHWIVILRPTPEFITLGLQHRTQILYHPDISLILMLLDAKSGKTLGESGTGSGSLSTALARAIAPDGRLYTLEFHWKRHQTVCKDFALYGVSHVVTATHRDVCADGFPDECKGCLDGIFLDLPSPWLALSHVDQALKEGGRLVNFSPCIEQTQRVCEALSSMHYYAMRTFEIVSKPWGINVSKQSSNNRFQSGRKRNISDAITEQDVGPAELWSSEEGATGNYASYNLNTRSHTGYLTMAIKPI